jgi:hypothetical protein
MVVLVLALTFRLFMKVIIMIATPTTNGIKIITIALVTVPIILPNIFSITLV